MPRGSRRGAKRSAAQALLRSGDGDGVRSGDGAGDSDGVAAVLRTPPGERVEDGHVVRSVGSSGRVYRCPGCDQELFALPHVVAWPQGRPDDRRHWHTACWSARARRGVKVHRSKNAPKHG